MHIRYIESFLALFEERNITKASQKLYISQQGLSRQIQTLEKEIGATLFERSKSGVVPTELCIKLFPHFESAYNSFMKAREVVKEHKTTHKKTIILAFASGVSQGLSTEVILNFQRENPDIPFQIKEWSKQKCIDKLTSGDADLALLVNPFDLNLFHTTRLTEGYMYIAIHKDHPLSRYEDIDFSLLDQQTIITGSEDNALRELFDHYCQLLRIEPNIMFSSSYSLDIINSGREPNVMATVTPIMTSKITNPDFKVHRLLTPEPGYLYSCMNKSKKPSKDLLAVSNYIQQYFSKIKVIKLPD